MQRLSESGRKKSSALGSEDRQEALLASTDNSIYHLSEANTDTYIRKAHCTDTDNGLPCHPMRNIRPHGRLDGATARELQKPRKQN